MHGGVEVRDELVELGLEVCPAAQLCVAGVLRIEIGETGVPCPRRHRDQHSRACVSSTLGTTLVVK
jgi:hypothetical protein